MKYWYMQFDTGAWLKDPKLSMCLPATRGIWIDAIAAMHEDARSGALSGTPCQLARVLRCSESALMDAIADLRSTGAGDVTERHGIVTLVNRRMNREAKDREGNRLRQSRHRGNGNKPPPVTEESQPSIYMSEIKDPPKSPRKPGGGRRLSRLEKKRIAEGRCPGCGKDERYCECKE